MVDINSGDGAVVMPANPDDSGDKWWQRSVAIKICRSVVGNRLGLIGIVVIVLIALFSFIGPLFYHSDISHTRLMDATLAPGAGHPLGTDNDGYDVLGRLMAGGQSSLEVGFAAAVLGSLVGTLVGAVAGFYGGWVDTILMRVVDSLLAIPALLQVLVLASIFVPNVTMLILVVAFVSWLPAARLVRGETLSLRERDFIQAANVMGTSRPKSLVRHIIPNVSGVIAVQTTFQVADAILLVAALSFLGLGPPAPAANWGGMLSDGLNYMFDGYWWLIYPAGILIVLTVVAFNLMGEALRDSFEVRMRRL